MDNQSLLQFIFLLITAPWWVPVVRNVAGEIWRAAEVMGDRPTADPRTRPDERSIPSAAQGRRAQRQVWSDQGATWSKRRVVNPVWDTGHGTVAPNRDGNRRKGFAHQRPSERRSIAPRRRFEGGFGRRGI